MGAFFALGPLPTQAQQGNGKGFRPPQWGRPQLTSISAKNTNSAVQVQDGVGEPGSTTYFFDAIFRADHTQELRSTEHPIQSGASIVDHSYLLPARLILEIGMSDAMQSFISGEFTSNNSKSISAYQTLLDIQSQRTPVKVTTRLRLYENMVIGNLTSPDDNRTQHGAKFTVHFKEIIVAQVIQNTISARPNQTYKNPIGTVQPEPVPDDLQKYLDMLGNWSSNQPNLPPSN